MKIGAIGAQIFVFLLSATGVAGVAPVAFAQLIGGSACPVLAGIPACYIVLLGYAIMASTAFFHGKHYMAVFLWAWLPLFAFAAFGSSLELVGQNTCPRNSMGIPMCFFSLGLLGLLLVAQLVSRRINNH